MADDRKPGPPRPPHPPGAPAPAGPVEPRPEPARRRNPLPSLAELGAFDGAPSPPRPRLTGRLGESDLRGTSAPAPLSGPEDRPAEPLARPKQGRSWHADTPFETVKTPEGVLLKRDAESREAAARSARMVPGVAIGWSDLQAAADAGWIDPDAAHALWARWLARKPLTRVEEDSSAMPVRRSAPVAPPGDGLAQSSHSSELEAFPRPDGTAAPPVQPRSADTPPAGPVPQVAQDAAASSPDKPAPATEPRNAGDPDPVLTMAPDGAPAPAPASGAAPAEAQAPASASAPEPEAPGDPAPAPEAPTGPGPSARPAPDFEPEVLPPSHEYEAYRAAERAYNRPTIEVVEVLEVPSLNPVRPPATSWVTGQIGLALLAAAAAALSIGVGSTVFGPWGSSVAAAGWAALAWRRTSVFHAQGQALRALLAAHLTTGLVAVTVWQLQVAMGLWPDARPVDLFADAVSRPAAPAMQVDWRWLSLAGITLAVAMVWLIRLRHPVMLASVTALAWAVAFQVVAGVLQSLGLSLQAMDGFMLMLGSLTLAAAVYADLVSRRAGLADYARWPYLMAAVLMSVGWLSAALMPAPVQALRAVGLVAFVALAWSLQRPAMAAIALAAGAFEVSWSLGRGWDSPWAGGAIFLAGLALVAALTALVAPRLPRWSRPLQFWMPRAWREILRTERPQGTRHTILGSRAAPSRRES